MINLLQWAKGTLYRKLKPKPKEKTETPWKIEYCGPGSYDLFYKEIEVSVVKCTSSRWFAYWKEPYDKRGFERWFIEYRVEASSKTKLTPKIIAIIDGQNL